MSRKSLAQIAIEFNGATFLLKVASGEMMSLNEIYEAAGSIPFREPSRWINNEDVVSFIAELCNSYNTDRKGIIKVTRGKGGGTWAHWKLAAKYAAYLEPALESAIFDVFRERIQEEIDPGKAIDRGILGYKKQGRGNNWIDQRVKSKIAWLSLTDTLKEQGVTRYGYAHCADSINVPIVGGTSKDVKKEKGLKDYESLRDAQDEVTLALINVAQVLSKDKIIKEDRRGDASCSKACFDISTKVAALRLE